MIPLPAITAWKTAKDAVALVPRWAWLAMGAALALLVLHNRWVGQGRDLERADQVKAQAIAVKSVLKQRDAAEAADRKQMATIGNKFDQEKDDAIREARRVADCYRTGKCRVHARFHCPAGPGVLPEAAGPAGVGDVAGQGGLLDADAEFLVREAGRADAVALQLAACQDVIRADRD